MASNDGVCRLLALAVSVAACSDKPPPAKPRVEEKPSAVEVPDEDDAGRGAAAIGARPWRAESCRARVLRTNLSVSCRHAETVDGKVKRQELKLVVEGYKGVGAYEASAMGSAFVDLDVGKTELGGARVEVSRATDHTVDGTFSWSPPAGVDAEAFSDGSFHAIIKK